MSPQDALFLLEVVIAPALALLALAGWAEGVAAVRRRKLPGYSGQCKKLKG